MPQPEQTFRIGSVSASVFVNEAKDDQPFRTVSLQRRYKTGDEWKLATSFSLNELPSAIAVLQLAMNHIASRESAAAEAERN